MRRKSNPTEEQITKVLRHQEMELDQIKSAKESSIIDSISETEELLKKLGYTSQIERVKNQSTCLAIIQALKDEADADKERIDYLQSLNVLLRQAIKDLEHDLGRQDHSDEKEKQSD